MANEMFKRKKTIDGYRAELFKKLNVSSRVGMVSIDGFFAFKHFVCDFLIRFFTTG
ncbi:MAG: hypothetical protein NTZ47_01720 [Bacteroidetes bacterium]|nr:hypothetical protein [Bacteroidota bacterium]